MSSPRRLFPSILESVPELDSCQSKSPCKRAASHLSVSSQVKVATDASSGCCGKSRIDSDYSAQRPASCKRQLEGACNADNDDDESLKLDSAVEPVSECRRSCRPAATKSRSILSLHNENTIPIEAHRLEIGQDLAHVSTTISGMTCTGCEGKLRKCITKLGGTNIKTSLLSGQADFDIQGGTSTDSLIEKLQKLSGFICVVRSDTIHQLSLILDDPRKAVTRHKINGISNCTVTGKNSISVIYEPRKIGARDVLAYYGSLGLAAVAPPAHDVLTKVHLRQAIHRTAMSATLTIPILILAFARIQPRPILYASISFTLATVVQFYIGFALYHNAVSSLLNSLFDIDLLVVVSTTAAYTYSVVAYGFLLAGRPLQVEPFFETSTLLITLILFGRWLTAFARHKAVRALAPTANVSNAILVQTGSGIDARLLHYGDHIRIPPETSVVTDGILLTGTAEVDESLITGESAVVLKQPGTTILAGSVNHRSEIVIEVQRLVEENTVQAILDMVDTAKASKPRMQQIADRVAFYFLPVILVLTVIVFLSGFLRLLRDKGGSNAAINAMTYAITVLAISCPCAIGLAVPMVIVIAGKLATKNGFIVKSTEAFEIASRASHVIFDKTGTLTNGKLQVIEHPGNMEALAIIASVLKNQAHPVAVAVYTQLKKKVDTFEIGDVSSITGSGLETTWEGHHYRLGHPFWLGVQNEVTVKELLDRGRTLLCVTKDSNLIATFGLVDTIREDSAFVLETLRARNIEVSLLSGDNATATLNVASQVGIPFDHVRSQCTPNAKLDYVQSLMKGGRVVIFCGDGTNDAAALAAASIGVNLAAGTEIARNASDVVLLRESVSGILDLLDLSRSVKRRIYINFAWSFLYNVVAILLAAGAIKGARIPPAYAGLGELVSILPVIAVAVHQHVSDFRRYKH